MGAASQHGQGHPAPLSRQGSPAHLCTVVRSVSELTNALPAGLAALVGCWTASNCRHPTRSEGQGGCEVEATRVGCTRHTPGRRPPPTSATTRLRPPSGSSTAGSILQEKMCWCCAAFTPGATMVPCVAWVSPGDSRLVDRMPVSLTSWLMVPSCWKYPAQGGGQGGLCRQQSRLLAPAAAGALTGRVDASAGQAQTRAHTPAPHPRPLRAWTR
jgi:hypothetical protein